MAKAKPIKGKDLMLFVNGKAIALGKTCQLQIKQETLDATSKDDGDWESNDIVDSKSYDINSDAVYSTDETENIGMIFDAIFDLFVAGQAVPVVFGVASNAAVTMPEGGWTAPTATNAKAYKGKVMITSMELNGNKGEAASFSISAHGVGPLEKVTGA